MTPPPLKADRDSVRSFRRIPSCARAAAQRQTPGMKPMSLLRTSPGHLKPISTPDGRYLIVRGRLWRSTNPGLPEPVRAALVSDLMDARREVKAATRKQDVARLAAARVAVNAAKTLLGERGPVWWADGAKDFNRYLVKNTPYAQWYAGLDVPFA